MPNRLVCTVLDEMRECCKTLNFSYIDSLIEEVQVLVNRMESALSDQSDYKYHAERLTKVRKDLKEAESMHKEMETLRGDHKKLLESIKKAEHDYARVTRGNTLRCNQCGLEYKLCACNK